MSAPDFGRLYAERWRWSLETFGPGPRTLGLTRHIRRELREIEEDPASVEEWVDVVMLALDGLARLGLDADSAVRALRAKHEINLTREWNRAGQDSPAEHVRRK